jgi:organic hydroperoxide reductase OsmC/OhrA
VTKTQDLELRLVWNPAEDRTAGRDEDYSRDYTVHLSGKPEVPGSAPGLHGGDDSRLSPEDLMLASLSACHMLTYLALAARNGLLVIGYEDAASGTVGKRSDGRIGFTEAVLRPHVRIGAGDPALAQRLHEPAHRHCFMTNSVSFPVRHEPTIDAAAAEGGGG